METNEAGLALIKYWERNPRTGTFYDRAYQDEEGVWTIGWGTIRWDMKTPVKEGETISEAEADRQIRKEVQRIDDALDKSITVTLTANEHAALSVWGYNVGIGWITGDGHQQATFIKKLNKGDYACVPAGLQQFTKGAKTGKSYTGLLNRRKQECALWLTPDDEPAAADTHAPPMPQAVVPDRPTPTQAVSNSASAKAAAVGVLMTAYQAVASGYSWLFSVAQEAGPQVVALKTTLSPLDALIKLSPAMMSTAVAGILAFVIFRKIATR